MAVEGKAARSLRNSAMHLRKACNHPFLFLAGQHPPYEPADAEEIVRASGKIHALDNILPKLRATGAPNPARPFYLVTLCHPSDLIPQLKHTSPLSQGSETSYTV